MKLWLWFGIISLTIFTSACATVQFNNGAAITSTELSSRQEFWQDMLFIGLWQIDEPVDLEKACPKQRWRRVVMKRTWLQSLISASLIYTPATISVECTAAQTHHR